MKIQKLFYSTGIKIIFSWYDIIKFKLRISDYDDTLGVYYYYLIAIKLFAKEFFKAKYRNSKGKIYKSKINSGG